MGPLPEGEIRRNDVRGVITPVVRLLDCSHIGAIQAIAAQSFETHWSAQDYGYFLAHDCRYTYGIFDGDTLVAYLIGLLVQGELDVITTATHPEYRRRGLAHSLFQIAMANCQIQKLFLEVETENTSAQALYRKLGFTTTGIRRGYYSSRKDAYTMSFLKNLARH